MYLTCYGTPRRGWRRRGGEFRIQNVAAASGAQNGFWISPEKLAAPAQSVSALKKRAPCRLRARGACWAASAEVWPTAAQAELEVTELVLVEDEWCCTLCECWTSEDDEL